MATATYTYCLVQSARKPSAARAPGGLPGATPPVSTAAAERLWVVHADVPLEQYGPGPLEASLQDLEWVSRIAVAHESVVEHFAALPGATVIPMKLFTMFSTVERVVAEMRGRSRGLRPIFARLRGCEEWGVRVLQRAAGKKASATARPSTGTAFLAARKQARDDARAAVSAAATAADAVYSSLAGLSSDHRRRPAGAPGAAAPLLDAAFLVPTRRRARFQTAAQKIARDVSQAGAQMTLSGPWPPYNFVGSHEETT
jgi:hypothetical protein